MKPIAPVTEGNRASSGADVLIVIINYNTKDLLRQCLDSLRICQDSIRFSVAVVDNASTDGSAEMVEAQYPRYRLLRNVKNMGFARANNLVFRLCPQYSYYLLLNPDATVAPSVIQTMLCFLAEHADVAAVGPALKLPGGRFQPGGAGWGPGAIHSINTFLMLSKINRRWKGLFIIQEHYADSCEPVMLDWLAGACMLVRAQALADVGLFDERYFVYGEDAEWCWRAREKGWEIAYLPNVVAHHQYGGSTNSIGWNSFAWFRNLAIAVRQRGSRTQYQIFLASALIGYSYRLVITMLQILVGRGPSARKRASQYASLWHMCLRLMFSAGKMHSGNFV